MKKTTKIFTCVIIVFSFISITSGTLTGKTIIQSVGIDNKPYLIDSVLYKLNSPPETPIINGTTHGKLGITYNYTFVSTDPDGDDVYYWIKWEPGCPSEYWFGPYPSGQEITMSHTFSKRGSYTISCIAKDIYNETSEPGSLEITMPKNKVIGGSFIKCLQNFFENYSYFFLIFQKVLSFFLHQTF